MVCERKEKGYIKAAINMNMNASTMLVNGPAILIFPFISSLKSSVSRLAVPGTANTKPKKCSCKTDQQSYRP